MTERERSLIDSSPTAFIAIDRRGRYLAFNAAAERLLGARPGPSDVAGQPRYVQLFHADGVTPMRDDQIPIVRALEGERIENLEVVFKRAGEHRPHTLAASAAPIVDDSGAIVGATVALHDITDLVEARKALDRSQKMEAIGRLAGAVAHDFNNLLTVIASYAHMLEPSFEPGDQRIEDVAEIRRASERAAALTKQLLVMSRH